MITALHALVYAEDIDAARAFFRDVLRFPFADTGGGWLALSVPILHAIAPMPGRDEGRISP